MAKGFSYRFYHSTDWEHAREQALQRDAYLCQHCLAQGIATPAVMVHHIVELTPANINDPNISTDPKNLVSLCDLCHKKVHGWVRQGSTRQGLVFDEDGNLISLDSEHTDWAQSTAHKTWTTKQQVRAPSNPPIRKPRLVA